MFFDKFRFFDARRFFERDDDGLALFRLHSIGVDPADIAVLTALDHVKAAVLRIFEQKRRHVPQLEPHHGIGHGECLHLHQQFGDDGAEHEQQQRDQPGPRRDAHRRRG